MRWKKKILSLALFLAGMAGCKQQCWMTECEMQGQLTAVNQLVRDIEFKPQEALTPASVIHSAAPATILEPDRPIRYMSLAEAVSIALEQGTVGTNFLSPGGLNGGSTANDQLNAGVGNNQTDRIRVLALDPAIAATTMELSLSKFDAVWATSMTWNTTDRPVGTALDVFQTGRVGATNAIMQDNANFTTSLVKPLPTGGVANITFNTQYQFTNLPARVNPAYTPSLTFGFEQPLLQGFGVEINQLRQRHPGSILNPGVALPAPQAEGILITRIRADQSRAEFERQVTIMLVNVETAYWNLYGAYWNLYARELGLRLAYESWKITGTQYYGGSVKLSDFARTRGQYELFRGQRLQALGQVLEAERQLRKLLGLSVEDGHRLVPSDTPTLAPYQPDYQVAMNEALTLRPELVLAREELKVRQLSLIEQRNFLLPDVRFTATYGINSIGSRLDGPDARNAFRNLAEADFANWEIGIRANVPLGFREAHANVRRARLELARQFLLLQDQEVKAVDFLAQQYRRLFEFYEQIRAQRAQREAYGLQLRTILAREGEQITLADTQVLEAQRFFTDALANEQNAIVQYNNTLALFEFAKGTILHHNNVVIGEGPLPHCAAERAVAHFARRDAGLVLKVRPLPVECCNEKHPELSLPVLSGDQAPSLMEALKKEEGAPPKPLECRPIDEVPMPMQKTEPEVSLPVTPGAEAPAQPEANAEPVDEAAPAWRMSLARPGGGGAPATPMKDLPPARQEQFGAGRILTSPVTSRDPAPTLAPASLGTPIAP